MSGTARTRAALEALFARGDKPSAQDVADLLASCYNLTDDDCADQLADAVTTALFAGIWSGLPLDPATSKARLSTLLARLASAHETLAAAVVANAAAISVNAAELVARPRANLLLNGGFTLWQRGTSHSTVGYGSADRWRLALVGTAVTMSRQAFTAGQTNVPGEPRYYMRCDVTSVAGAANYAFVTQRVEDVRSAAGQTVSVSFYAKADAPKNIAVVLTQFFGSSGSTQVSLPAQTVSLTDTWQRFELSFDLPSLAGKTISGTSPADFLQLEFWLDAGTDWNTRTDALGQQSGTFDFSQVKLELGANASAFVARLAGEELALCQRFYQTGFIQTVEYVNAAGSACFESIGLPVTLRASPALNGTYTYTANATGGALGAISLSQLRFSVNSIAAGIVNASVAFTADAEI